MNFLLSGNNIYNRGMEIDYQIIKDLVSFNHTISYAYCNDLLDSPAKYRNHIPVGNLKFMEFYFNTIHGIKHIYPLEIPQVLRKEKFLKREYSIVYGKDLPKAGRYFVKDVDNLKSFSFNGDIMDLPHHTVVEADTLYQVSTEEDIISEYRVYVLNSKISDISYYNGDPLVFPDVKLIQEMVAVIAVQEDLPVSYTLDVMVTKKGTALVEMHNFMAVGLYSTIWGTDLLYAYKHGVEYLKKYNKRLEVYKGKGKS